MAYNNTSTTMVKVVGVSVVVTMASSMTMVVDWVVANTSNKAIVMKKWLYMLTSMHGKKDVIGLATEEST